MRSKCAADLCHKLEYPRNPSHHAMSAVIHTLPHHSTATTITHSFASGTHKLDRQDKWDFIREVVTPGMLAYITMSFGVAKSGPSTVCNASTCILCKAVLTYSQFAGDYNYEQKLVWHTHISLRVSVELLHTFQRGKYKNIPRLHFPQSLSNLVWYQCPP